MSDYGSYCRPKLHELLHVLGLDLTYVKASGDWLETSDGRKVLDLVGGFGATILGHNHPALKQLMVESLMQDVPGQVQVSERPESGILARRLSELASGRVQYMVNVSNSGTEAMEAAFKHAYKKHLDMVRREFERTSRLLQDFFAAMDGAGHAPELPGGKSLGKFRDDLSEYNLGQFEQFQNHPCIVAFSGSFHGKTSASLKVTFNKTFREPFEGMSALRPLFVDPDKPELIPEILEREVCRFCYPHLQEGRVEVRTCRVGAVMALVLETIRGEGGIRPLPEGTLEFLATHVSGRLPLIIDEVQTGCGRTGSFFSFHLTPLARIDPEYLVLSKALGGGMVKIGATLIRKDVYDQDFGILHTSTFGEDGLGSRVACKVLDLMGADNQALCRQAAEKGNELKARLCALKDNFPELVADVRGRGLMLGIEFTDMRAASPFFRATGKQGVLSLLVASYLLHYHQIRVFAPLSTILKGNPGKKRQSVIRLQPSVYLEHADMQRLVDALREVLEVIRRNNEFCLVGHLFGQPLTSLERLECPEVAVRWPPADGSLPHRIDARTGFVVNPTCMDDLVDYFFGSFRYYSIDRSALEAWWNRLCRFIEPVHCRSDHIHSQGFVIENNMVFVPYLPEYLNQADKPPWMDQEIRDKVQDAVTIARELGDDNIPVTMVGLGAYTSIVTHNGLDINDYEVPVTTGNAYTTALIIQGILRACRIRNLDMASARVGVLGANGNIGMVLARILSLRAGSLVLVGSSSSTSQLRLQRTRQNCFEEILGAREQDLPSGTAYGTRLLHWLAQFSPDRNTGGPKAVDDPAQCAGWLESLALQGTGVPAELQTSTSILALADCDIVVVATNSADPRLVRPSHVKPGAIVCCASIPSNLSPEFDDLQDRYHAFDGGLALLPEGCSIDFTGMPGNGLVFGCLAETLLCGFEGLNHSFCKGRLTSQAVRSTMDMARDYGFGPGRFTLHHKRSPYG